MIATYRKRPVVIRAVQWRGTNFEEIKEFAGKSCDMRDSNLIIHTLEGDMKVNFGDYIIEGILGEFYPCKPDIFENTYEFVPCELNEEDTSQMSNEEHLIENLIFGMKDGRDADDILAEPVNQDILKDPMTCISEDAAVRIACHVVYSLYDGRYPDNGETNISKRKYTEHELDKMRPYYHVFRNAVVSGIIPVDRAVSDWMNEMDELLEEQRTVYAVIEEYDPYVSYPAIESRAELQVQGVFKSLEKALDIRNDLARHEAEEYDIEIDEADYANPDKPISVLGSEFYIREFEVE